MSLTHKFVLLTATSVISSNLVAQAEPVSPRSTELVPVAPELTTAPVAVESPLLITQSTSGTNATQPPPRPHYIGIGGNVGLRGDATALGDGGLAVVSKVGFSKHLSLHNQGLFGKRTTGVFALTGGLPIRNSNRVVAYPFIGAGASTVVDDGLNISPAVLGGVDLPLSRNVTSTFRVNARFEDDTEVGLTLGVGYNFRSPF